MDESQLFDLVHRIETLERETATMDERAYQYEIAGLKARVERDSCILRWHQIMHCAAVMSLIVIALLLMYTTTAVKNVAKDMRRNETSVDLLWELTNSQARDLDTLNKHFTEPQEQ